MTSREPAVISLAEDNAGSAMSNWHRLRDNSGYLYGGQGLGVVGYTQRAEPGSEDRQKVRPPPVE